MPVLIVPIVMATVAHGGLYLLYGIGVWAIVALRRRFVSSFTMINFYAPCARSSETLFIFQNLPIPILRLKLLRTIRTGQSMSLVLLESISVPVQTFAVRCDWLSGRTHRTYACGPSNLLQNDPAACRASGKPGTHMNSHVRRLSVCERAKGWDCIASD